MLDIATASEDRVWTGKRLRRFEDDRFITGRGRYVADIDMPGTLHAAVLRSPVASGRLLGIDAAAALRLPGVVAVLTGQDAATEGLGGIPWEVCPPGFEDRAAFPGDPAVAAPQPILALDAVRYVGEPVALIVAETRALAEEASALVSLQIAETTPTIGLDEKCVQALRQAGIEPAFSIRQGDAAAVETIMRAAPHVVSLRTHIPRLAAVPI